MAASLIPRLLACLSLVPALALAQQLPDPTRPPAAAMPLAPGAELPPPVPTGPVLQAVMLAYRTPQESRAVISGATVRVGDKVGDATVARIAANSVVLRTGRKEQVLQLYPDGEPTKKP